MEPGSTNYSGRERTDLACCGGGKSEREVSNDAEGFGMERIIRVLLLLCMGAVCAEDITTSVPWAEFATGVCGGGGEQYLRLLRHHHLLERSCTYRSSCSMI